MVQQIGHMEQHDYWLSVCIPLTENVITIPEAQNCANQARLEDCPEDDIHYCSRNRGYACVLESEGVLCCSGEAGA